MKRIFLIIIGLWIISSCDSGDIYPPDPILGRDIEVSIKMTGVSTIPEPRLGTKKYERKLAFLYYKDSDMKTSPIISHIKLGDVQENTSEVVTISNTHTNSGLIILAIIGEDNEIIYQFDKKKVGESTELTQLDWGKTINLVNYDRVQEQLFDLSCTSCHDSKGAKNLSLIPNKSYNSIVNKASKTDPSIKLVEPSDISNSMLYQRLINPYNTDVYFDHRNITTLKTNDIDVLKHWIQDGAKR